GKQNEIFEMGDMKVFPQQLRAEHGVGSRTGFSVKVDLSLRDIKTLKLFHDNKGKILTTEMLRDYCWGANLMPDSQMVERHINQLRKKIEIVPETPEIIKTVPGGFIFE